VNDGAATLIDDNQMLATSGGRSDSDTGISLMGNSGNGPPGDGVGGHGLTHSTMRPQGGTHASSTSSTIASLTTSAIFGLPRSFPDISVSTSSSLSSMSSPPMSPDLPSHFSMATLNGSSGTSIGNEAFPMSTPGGLLSPVMFSPTSQQAPSTPSIFSTFATMGLSRALSIPVPQAPAPGAPITFSPNPSRSSSPSFSSSTNGDNLPLSSDNPLHRANSAPVPSDSETLPNNNPYLGHSVSLFGRGPSTSLSSFAPRPLFPVAQPLTMSNSMVSFTAPSSSTSASVPTSPSPPSSRPSAPPSPPTPHVNTYSMDVTSTPVPSSSSISIGGASPLSRSMMSPIAPPVFALTVPSSASTTVGSTSSSTTSGAPSSPQRATSFLFSSPSPARLPPRHGQPAPPLFLRSKSEPVKDGQSNDSVPADMESPPLMASHSSDGNALPSDRSTSSFNVTLVADSASTSISPSDSQSTNSNTFLASPAANYGVSIGGKHRAPLRRPFSLVMPNDDTSNVTSVTSLSSSVPSGGNTPDSGRLTSSNEGPSRAYSTPIVVMSSRDTAVSIGGTLPHHHLSQTTGMAVAARPKSAADVYGITFHLYNPHYHSDIIDY
jgi:hypothetical protein